MYFVCLSSNYLHLNKSIMDKDYLAKILYDKYCEAVGGKAFNGDDLPKSEEFFADETKEKQVNAWRKVADAAYENLC